VPAGTLLGDWIGWRPVIGLMSLLTLVLLAWVLWKVPDYPGQPAGQRMTVGQAFVLPGIRPILTVVLTWMLAHNILYTYIEPFLEHLGLASYCANYNDPLLVSNNEFRINRPIKNDRYLQMGSGNFGSAARPPPQASVSGVMR